MGGRGTFPKGVFLAFRLPECSPPCMLTYGIGNDLALLRLVQEATQAAGWRTDIDTGRRAFPVGKNSRHVRDLGDDGRGGEVYMDQHVADVVGVSEGTPDEL